MADNGKEYPADLDPGKWEILGPDLDGDGDEAERNVLYASDSFMDDLASSSETGITKQVRADSDRFGSWQDRADVALGEGYSYEITVTNATDTLRDIVVFDRLENAGEDRAGSETFDENWWYGVFDGVTTTGLAQAGIAPVIYYNADRSAKIPSGAETPGEILTAENGWLTREAWEAAGRSAAEVKAVAVDLSTGTDGAPFELGENESVTFRIRMISPSEDESLDSSDHGNTSTGTTPAEHAYNNASYYSFADKTGTGTTLPATPWKSARESGKESKLKKN